MHKPYFDRTDYSVVVKNRARPPKAWRWEIYRAERSSPIKRSLVYFDTMVANWKSCMPGRLKHPRDPAHSPKGVGDGRFEE